MTRDQELAWAAGFFDGEGCTFTSVRKDCRSMALVISLCQDSRGDALVVEFHTIVGVGNVHRSKRMVQWKVGGYKSVSTVVELLRPYLHQPKLAQAELACERYLAYYNHK